MSQAQDLVRRYLTAFNAHDVEAACAMVAEDLVNHAAVPEAQGRAGFRTIVTKLLKAVPDLTMTIEDVIAEGDKVVCRLTCRGTHSGNLDFTRMPLPASNKQATFEAIHVFRVVSGVIVEHWAQRDDLALLRQLGLKPQPIAASASTASVAGASS